MQTPRVEWFVSKGQRLPIGQSPPDVTGARLLLVCAPLAEFFAYLRQLQSQPGAAAGGRAAPRAGLRGGRSLPRAPEPGASVSSAAALEQPGLRPLALSPLAPQRAACSQKQCPLHFKRAPPPLTSSPHTPFSVPLWSRGSALSPCYFSGRTLLKPQREEDPHTWAPSLGGGRGERKIRSCFGEVSLPFQAVVPLY
ncbi:unnamed protein product [Nyctereutes procyonoides]|uniref:(raccoon dog) hypothetical protein n=1 Tax=Nyctereutes procyonoides TaxID=34880 RepID=A0A811ZP22_NYCPR|nr:unnamed protein product [Nyctereutes procyonoides]